MDTQEERLVDDVTAVTQVINRVYEDGTTVFLDRQAAREILAELRRRGWADLGVIGALIASAGGEIEVPEKLLADPPTTVTVYDDYANRSRRFRASKVRVGETPQHSNK